MDSKSPCARRATLSARVESRPVSERTMGSAVGADCDVTALWKSVGIAPTRSTENVNSIVVTCPSSDAENCSPLRCWGGR
jgi:hypothetical protein